MRMVDNFTALGCFKKPRVSRNQTFKKSYGTKQPIEKKKIRQSHWLMLTCFRPRNDPPVGPGCRCLEARQPASPSETLPVSPGMGGVDLGVAGTWWGRGVWSPGHKPALGTAVATGLGITLYPFL